MTAPPVVRVRAFAKINIALRVLGIRPDGYHELRTTFQSLALHDTIICRAGRGPFALTVDAPDVPADSTNLVWKAAEALWRSAGRRGELSGVDVHLRKRIPSEAGLGGGSSDAASVLRALRALWRLRVPDAELETVARQLGADVPFFLRGGRVLGLDRGDALFQLEDVPRTWVVVVRPDFGVSSRDAYGWWDADQRGSELHGAVATEPVNDLEPAVVARHPRIGRLVRALRRRGARAAAMSGSGSAVFGVFDTRAAAVDVSEHLRSRSVAVWVTRTVTKREFTRLSAPARR